MDILALLRETRVNNKVFCVQRFLPIAVIPGRRAGRVTRRCSPRWTDEGGCTRMWGLGHKCVANAAYTWGQELKVAVLRAGGSNGTKKWSVPSVSL